MTNPDYDYIPTEKRFIRRREVHADPLVLFFVWIIGVACGATFVSLIFLSLG